jgi:hypothetical protein
MSASGAFSASSAGSSSSGSGKAGQSSGKSSMATSAKSSTKASAKSASYSISSNYSVSSHNNQTQSNTANISPTVNVSFNAMAHQSPTPQRHNLNFKQSTREQVALRNEKSQALYANQKNWEHEKRKISTTAFPEPSNDMMQFRYRNINQEYSGKLAAHRYRIRHISVKFDTQIKDVRTSSNTLSKSFAQSNTQAQKTSAKAQVGKYQRPKINNNFNHHTLEKGRGR